MSNSNERPPPDFLTVQEVATYLRVSRNTVWRWCVSGALDAVKIGRNWRIPQTALEEFLQQQKNQE